MKVAVSLEEPLLDAANAMAQRMGLSRSKLIAKAVEDFIQAHDTDAITKRLNAVYSQTPAVIPDDIKATQSALLADEGW